jgi:hypothetical protein
VMTEFGEVHLERKLYQADGADALAPLDAAMELPDEKYSLNVRRIVAEEAARASFDQVVELVKKQSGAEVPKRQAEELAVRATGDFDDFYRSRLREPEESDQLLVLSFDGKGIATLHRDLREATRKKAVDAAPARNAADEGREAEPQADGGGGHRVLGRRVAAHNRRRVARRP